MYGVMGPVHVTIYKLSNVCIKTDLHGFSMFIMLLCNVSVESHCLHSLILYILDCKCSAFLNLFVVSIKCLWPRSGDHQIKCSIGVDVDINTSIVLHKLSTLDFLQFLKHEYKEVNIHNKLIILKEKMGFYFV